MVKRATSCFIKGPCKTERGSSLVEFGVLLSVLLLLVLGAIDFGRLAYMYIEVHNAARAGVSYGAQSHITAADTNGMQNAASADAPDLPAKSPTSFAATATHYCVCSNNNSQSSSSHVTCAISSCSGALLVEYVQVNTQANYQPWIPWTGLNVTTTVTGQVQMEVSQ